MNKRYVFWRNPNGSPSTNDKDAPTALLAKFGKSTSINDEGGVQRKDFSFLRLEIAIRLSVVVINPERNELNDDDAWYIVHTSLTSIILRHGGGKRITPVELIEEADKRAAMHFRKKRVPYVLVSTLNIDSFPCARIQVGDYEVAPLKDRNRYPEPKGRAMKHMMQRDATS